MTFSTRGNPRLAQSGVALTSLGAVGGARGTAAGALRIFVEFLTTYNRGEINQLQSDLNNLQHEQNNSAIAEEKRQRRLTTVRNNLAESERVIRGKLNTQLRGDLKEIEALEKSRSKTNRDQAAQQRVIFNQTAKSLGVTKEELQLISQRSSLSKEESVLKARSEKADLGQLQRSKQILQVESQLGKLQAGRAALLPKLGGLAVGALGGIVGGAILGVGFQAADAAISAIGEKIQDLIDPARHAREAIAQLGDEVLQLARDQNLSLFDAATQKANELGVANEKGAVSMLAEFAATKKAADAAKEYADFVTAGGHADSLRSQAIENLRVALVAQAKAQQDAKIAQDQANGVNVANLGYLNSLPLQIRTVNGQVTQLINGEDSLTLATRLFDQILGDNTATINENAAARSRLAAETALANAQQDTLNETIARQTESRSSAIQARIDNLGSGESARTRRIQAAIDAAQSGGGSGLSDQLKNIAEQRQLILLRQRLRLLGENINLEKFSGKFLLEAINAKIAAIQKEGEAQHLLNQELDLQFKMSQTIKRQAGESINEFIERRAQEQRSLLAEQADLDRQRKISSLQALQEKVQDEVALQELEEQKLQALRQAGTSNHLKELQKQLKASQDADRRALDAKRRALEAQQKALAQAAKDAQYYATIAANDEIKQAIRAAKTVEQLASISGKTRGLEAAKQFLQALLQSGVLQPGEAANIQAAINRINSTLQAANQRYEDIVSHSIQRPGGGPIRFAKGGIFPLTNASSPFGQNARFGEEGTEYGMVISHKMSEKMQGQTGAGQIGPFTINESSNPYRDRYMFKQAVREALSEVMG